MTDRGQGRFFHFHRWWLSVTAIYLPFVLFMFLLGFQTTGGALFAEVIKVPPAPSELAPTPGLLLKLESQLLLYSGYLLIHVLLAVAVGGYFLVHLRRQLGQLPTALARRCGLFTLAFTLTVMLLQLFVVYTHNPFSGLTIEPFHQLAQLAGLAPGFARMQSDSLDYLRLAQLVPVLVAIPTGVMASASFHLMVFQLPPSPSHQDLVAPLKLFKHALAMLSLILVSAVVTASFYFQLIPAIVGSEALPQLKAYAKLAATLSSVSGLLFSATMIAAFLPGAATLLIRYHGLPVRQLSSDDETGMGLQPLQLLRILIAVLAPAATSPVLDVIRQLLGGAA